jgi:hypothetical protein
VPGYGGGGIYADMEGGAANTALSFVDVTATNNNGGRSRTGIDCVSCIIASLVTWHGGMYIDVYGGVGNVVCQVCLAAAGYPHPSVAVLHTRRYRL